MATLLLPLTAFALVPWHFRLQGDQQPSAFLAVAAWTQSILIAGMLALVLSIIQSR